MRGIIIVTLFLLTSCSGAKLASVATKGEVAETDFNKSISFYYEKQHIYIDVVLNDSIHTFLFDTGYDVTMVDKSLKPSLDFKLVKEYKTSGSSFDAEKLQYGFIPSLEIEGVSFTNIGIGIQDLHFVKSPFSDQRKIAGIIGANILRKAHWQINYKTKIIHFSDKLDHLGPLSNALVCEMAPRTKGGWGYNRISVGLNGVSEQFVFDTGSSGGFTGNDMLLEKLIESGVISKTEGKSVNITSVTFGDLSLKDVDVKIEKGVRNLIGNQFLEDYVVTMDWANNKLYFQKNN